MNLFRPFIVVAVLVAGWAALTYAGLVSPLILPPPGDVLIAAVGLLAPHGGLWTEVGATAGRTLVALAISCAVGVPLGLVMGYLPRVYSSLEFLVDFFRSIPPIVLFPLFLITLGLGEPSKVGVAVYGCTLVLIVNSAYGVLNAPRIRRTVGTAFGFSRYGIFAHIVLPDALPQVAAGIRTALSLALVLTVVVEMMLGSTSGIGKAVYEYHLAFATDKMYATIIVAGLLGYGLNKGWLLLERKLVHWAH
jgi:NitT/TauT family transport system permease protein